MKILGLFTCLRKQVKKMLQQSGTRCKVPSLFLVTALLMLRISAIESPELDESLKNTFDGVEKREKGCFSWL